MTGVIKSQQTHPSLCCTVVPSLSATDSRSGEKPPTNNTNLDGWDAGRRQPGRGMPAAATAAAAATLENSNSRGDGMILSGFWNSMGLMREGNEDAFKKKYTGMYILKLLLITATTDYLLIFVVDNRWLI